MYVLYTWYYKRLTAIAILILLVEWYIDCYGNAIELHRWIRCREYKNPNPKKKSTNILNANEGFVFFFVDRVGQHYNTYKQLAMHLSAASESSAEKSKGVGSIGEALNT